MYFQLSTVCSLGMFGIQLGGAFGYILPPIMVRDSSNLNDIGDGLKLMCWTLTISMIPVTLLVLFCKYLSDWKYKHFCFNVVHQCSRFFKATYISTQ